MEHLRSTRHELMPPPLHSAILAILLPYAVPRWHLKSNASINKVFICQSDSFGFSFFLQSLMQKNIASGNSIKGKAPHCSNTSQFILKMWLFPETKEWYLIPDPKIFVVNGKTSSVFSRLWTRALNLGNILSKGREMERSDCIICIAGLVASVHEADSFPDSTSTNTRPAREN